MLKDAKGRMEITLDAEKIAEVGEAIMRFEDGEELGKGKGKEWSHPHQMCSRFQPRKASDSK